MKHTLSGYIIVPYEDLENVLYANWYYNRTNEKRTWLLGF